MEVPPRTRYIVCAFYRPIAGFPPKPPVLYFWLTIQNTANRPVSNAFGLLATFISFPLVRAAAARESTTKSKKNENR
jgi:hypothetical protein